MNLKVLDGHRVIIGTVIADRRDGLSLPANLSLKIDEFLESNELARWANSVSLCRIYVSEILTSEYNEYNLMVRLTDIDYTYWRLASG